MDLSEVVALKDRFSDSASMVMADGIDCVVETITGQPMLFALVIKMSRPGQRICPSLRA